MHHVHCNVNSAAEKMNKILNTDSKKSSKINQQCNCLNNGTTIKKLLIDQICSKGRWRESLLHGEKWESKEFIEMGPGKVPICLAKEFSGNMR